MLLRRYYKKVKTKVEEPKEEVVLEETYPNIDDITKREIIEILETKDMEFKPYDNKNTLYKIMIES